MSIHLVIGTGLQDCYFSPSGTLYSYEGMFTQQLLDKAAKFLGTLKGNYRVCMPFLVRRPDDSFYQNDLSY